VFVRRGRYGAVRDGDTVVESAGIENLLVGSDDLSDVTLESNEQGPQNVGQAFPVSDVDGGQ
jgi:hypothetical protein